jgi:hypothetical protein
MAIFPCVEATVPYGKGIIPNGKGLFPYGNGTFPCFAVSFPYGTITDPYGTITFPCVGGTVPTGKGILPIGMIAWTIGKVAHPALVGLCASSVARPVSGRAIRARKAIRRLGRKGSRAQASPWCGGCADRCVEGGGAGWIRSTNKIFIVSIYNS